MDVYMVDSVDHIDRVMVEMAKNGLDVPESNFYKVDANKYFVHQL